MKQQRFVISYQILIKRKPHATIQLNRGINPVNAVTNFLYVGAGITIGYFHLFTLGKNSLEAHGSPYYTPDSA